MSSNITQFPLMEEYLRAYPIAEDGKINFASIYPLRQFRVLTSDLAPIITNAIAESNKVFNVEDTSMASQALNFHINAGVVRLMEEGKVIAAEKFQHVLTNQLNACFDNHGIVTTCDGYTVFNPGKIPLSPSPQTH